MILVVYLYLTCDENSYYSVQFSWGHHELFVPEINKDSAFTALRNVLMNGYMTTTNIIVAELSSNSLSKNLTNRMQAHRLL